MKVIFLRKIYISEFFQIVMVTSIFRTKVQKKQISEDMVDSCIENKWMWKYHIKLCSEFFILIECV